MQDHRFDGGQRSGLRLQSFTAIAEMGGSYIYLPGGANPEKISIGILGGNGKVS
jgi:hypothetical protein